MFAFLSTAASTIPRRATLGRLVSQSTALLMISIGALILGLALLILFHENANATKGYSLRKLESQRSILLLEQEVLNMHIAQAQAIESLQSDPQIAAMIPYGKTQYMNEEQKVAVRVR